MTTPLFDGLVAAVSTELLSRLPPQAERDEDDAEAARALAAAEAALAAASASGSPVLRPEQGQQQQQGPSSPRDVAQWAQWAQHHADPSGWYAQQEKAAEQQQQQQQQQAAGAAAGGAQQQQQQQQQLPPPGTPLTPGGIQAELGRAAQQAAQMLEASHAQPKAVAASGSDALSAAREQTGENPTGAAAAVDARGGWAVVAANSVLRVLRLKVEEKDGEPPLLLPALPLSPSPEASSPAAATSLPAPGAVLTVPLVALFAGALPEEYATLQRQGMLGVANPVALFDRQRRRFVVVAAARDARPAAAAAAAVAGSSSSPFALPPLVLIAASAADGARPDTGSWVAAALPASVPPAAADEGVEPGAAPLGAAAAASCAGGGLRPEFYHPQASVDTYGLYVTGVVLCAPPLEADKNEEQNSAAAAAAAVESAGPLLLAVPKGALYRGNARLPVAAWTGDDLHAAVDPRTYDASLGDFVPGE
jgi:hypothetical protein